MKIGWIFFVIGIFCLKLEPAELTSTKEEPKSQRADTRSTEPIIADVEPIGPIQILAPNGTSFQYVENNRLEQILNSTGLKDYYIVVISAVGEFQTGKSFFLNILLDFLRSKVLKLNLNF